MHIKDVRWTPVVNMLIIECDNHHTFEHRADRWQVRCPECGDHRNLGRLRQFYMEQQRRKEPT